MSWLPYLQLLRLPAVFTAWADILAAHWVIAGAAPRFDLLPWLLLSTTCLYWAGMVLNDCFDLAVDGSERPERPLPSGRIAVSRAWGLGWTLLIAGVLAAAAAGPTQLVIAMLLAAAIVAYDAWLKHGAAGPVAMGLCRYLNWLLGLSVVALGPAAFMLSLPMFIYVFSLTLLSRTEVAAQDRRPLLFAAAGIVVTGVVILGLLLAGILSDYAVLALLAAAVVFLARDLYRTWSDFRPPRIRVSVRNMILGILVLDAILVAGAGHWWGALLVLLLVIPGRLLARAIPVT